MLTPSSSAADGTYGHNVRRGLPGVVATGDNADMDLAGVRAEVAAVDDLLRIVITRKVDLNDPDWVASARAGLKPVDEAGVSPETTAALEALLSAYETGDGRTRVKVRETFRDYRSFRREAQLPREWETVSEFRRHLVLISASGEYDDPRDVLMSIWQLCNEARARSIDVEPVLRAVAAISSDVAAKSFGSMRKMIMRGLEEHDLS
jgi:hypothetical protein